MGGTGCLGPLEGPLHAQIYFVVLAPLYPIGFHVRLSTFMDSLTSWALGFYSVLLGLFVYFNPTIALDISSASQGDCGGLVSRVWRKRWNWWVGGGGDALCLVLPPAGLSLPAGWCQPYVMGHGVTSPQILHNTVLQKAMYTVQPCVIGGPYGMTGFMPRGIKYLLSSDSPAFSATLTTHGALTYTTPAWGCCAVQQIKTETHVTV